MSNQIVIETSLSHTSTPNMLKLPSRMPGRFPSPTPAPESPINPSTDQLPSCPLIEGSRASPIDLDRIESHRTRPRPKETQNESLLSRTRDMTYLLGVQQGFGELPSSLKTSRGSKPAAAGKRTVSDTQYDRPKSTNGCSPSNSGTKTSPKHHNLNPEFSENKNATEEEPKPKICSPQESHNNVRDKVRKIEVEPDKKKGIVYILQRTDKPNQLKVGRSEKLAKRIGSIERQCGLTLKVIFCSEELDDFSRAEALVKEDLRYLRRPYICEAKKCYQKHGEWHEISQEQAIATVERWVAFLQLSPYTKSGKLKGIWDQLLTKRTNQLRQDTDIDHETRWKHWDSVLCTPTSLQLVEYTLDRLKARIWEFSWQFSTVFSWLVTFVVIRNSLSFIALLISFMCFLFSLFSHLKVNL